MRIRLFATAVVIWLGTALLPAEQGARRFSLDDFSRVARVSDPQIAPDGRSIAVVISRANLDENRYEPELTLVDIATGRSAGARDAAMLGVDEPALVARRPRASPSWRTARRRRRRCRST